MALFVPILGQLSGKIANNVFSHNRGGNYVRAKGQNVRGPSARQASVRATLATASAAWRTLTSAQRAGWKTWASLNTVLNRVGASIQLSGIAAYNTMAARALDAAMAPVVSPPVTANPAALLTCSGVLTAATDAVSLAFTTTPLAAGSKIAVYTSPPLSPSQDPNQAQSTLVGYSAAAQTSPYVSTLPFDVASGTVLNLWISVVDSAGRRSPSLKVRPTAA